MSQGKRYKFQGSTVSVQSALAATKTVSAITKANPAVVTSTAHGYADNDFVYLNNIPGMIELEDGTFVINVLTANTFELVGVDSTNYGTFVAESPNTATAQKATMTQFCELTGFNNQGGAATQIDVTTICSTAKEFELGLSDSGTVTMDFNDAPLQTVQAALRAANIAKSVIGIKVVFPGSGGTILMLGFVLQTSFQGAVDQTWKASASLKLTGDIVVVAT